MEPTGSEFYLHDGALIDAGEWRSQIAALRAKVDEQYGPQMVGCTPPAYFRKMWLAEFERAVIARAQPHVRAGREIGVLFSGGVDSTFIAFILRKHDVPFTCYTVGFQDAGTKEPEDVVEARQVAQRMGWQHKERVLGLGETEAAIKETCAILGDVATPVTVGVGAVVVAAAHLAAADGVTVLFGGLGSEEIFAGYERHGEAADTNEECWRGMTLMYERDLLRDSAIARALGITVPTPFLDLRVMEWGMYFPASMKIVDGVKKHVLRVIAQDAGLPPEFAFRPKRAAQYGSRFDSALERLARRNGSSKKEYVASLATPKPL